MSYSRTEELERLLDDLSYQVTAARSAGRSRPDELRAALKRMTGLIANLDALAVTEIAERKGD